MKNSYIRSIRTTNKNYIASFIVVFVAVVWYGFDSEFAKIERCEASVKSYITAEYSETTTSFDAEGELVTDTDYWSEPASDVMEVVTVDGELVYKSDDMDTTKEFGVWFPPYPNTWEGFHRGDVDFDNFKSHMDDNLKVTIVMANSREISVFSDPVESNPKCVLKLDTTVDIKTWYGVSYGFNF